MPAGNLHLTLHFLGATAEDAVEAVQQALGPLARAPGPCVLSPGPLDAFPSPAHGRVVVIPVHDTDGALAALQRDVVRALTPLGFPGEARDFRPHITVARTREARDLRRWLVAARAPLPAKLTAGALGFFRSDPGPGGPLYTALARFPFTPSRTSQSIS